MNSHSHEASMSADSCAASVVDAERVASVRRVLPADESVRSLAQVFALLADPGRLRLISALLEGGEMCVCDLSAATGQGTSAVSHALRMLRVNGVVKVRRSGRMAYYSLADSHVRLLFDLAITHVTHNGDDAHDEGDRP
jgi:ArsR family transcriptional regulator, lead/cadmium/zinc/bismuth-responsive transcriptional repressor